MTPLELVETVYLGDRGCKSILLEAWERRVTVHVDLISRIRSETGDWDFYDAEDIPEGRIVFEAVSRVRFGLDGPLPDDFIGVFEVKAAAESSSNSPVYACTLSIGGEDTAGNYKEVVMEIDAGDLYLVDPRFPSRKIRE